MNSNKSDPTDSNGGDKQNVLPHMGSFIFVCVATGAAIVMTSITLLYAIFFVDQVDCKDRQHENIDALHAQGVGFVTVASITLFVEVLFLIVVIVSYVKQLNNNPRGAAYLAEGSEIPNNRFLHMFKRLMYGLLVVMVVTWPSIGFGSLYMYPRASLDQLALDIFETTEGQNDHWYKCFDKVHKHVKTGYYITAAGALMLCWFAAMAHSRLVLGTSIENVMTYLSNRRVDHLMIQKSIINATANQREVMGYLIVTIIMISAYIVTISFSLKYQVEFQNEFSEGCNSNEHAFQRQTVTGVHLLIAAITSMSINIVVSILDAAYESRTTKAKAGDPVLKCRGNCDLIAVLRVMEYISITICIITTVIACIGVWTFPFDTLRAIMTDYILSFSSYTTDDMQKQHEDYNKTFTDWTQCLDKLDVFGNKKKWFIMFSSVIVTQVGIIYIASLPPIAKWNVQEHSENDMEMVQAKLQEKDEVQVPTELGQPRNMMRSCAARRR
ncbi:hypothetical protein CYMTET_2585 [Cymbomonas tetramitiformis]|uniref:Uncharacterized protein n=1 Tax=Cymbomonas tetramitiformis TaxID=36881 RepID=A0AAE0LLW8_9CHLO|nr:hypothetical protein CYMTET_2585 [Cymbomonas tetramitiformis]